MYGLTGQIVTLALLFLDGVLFIYHIPYLGPVCRPAPGGPIDPKLLQNAPFWCKTDFLKFFFKVNENHSHNNLFKIKHLTFQKQGCLGCNPLFNFFKIIF
jgi:hypothetical protein